MRGWIMPRLEETKYIKHSHLRVGNGAFFWCFKIYFISPSALRRRVFFTVGPFGPAAFFISLSRGRVAAGVQQKHKKEPHMANKKNTTPSIGESADSGVMHNPQPSRARTHACVVDRRDIKDIPCSQTARACARTRTRVENPAAYFKAWRIAKWGGDFDPVLAAVEEAGPCGDRPLRDYQ